MRINRQDLALAGIFLAIGMAFALNAILYIRIGTPLRMGPGFVPLLYAGILGLCALLILGRSIGRAGPAWTPTAWRASVWITAAIFAFGFGLEHLGLIPTCLLAIFTASFASRRMTVLNAIAVSVAFTAFAVVVFVYALHLPIPLMWTLD